MKIKLNQMPKWKTKRKIKKDYQAKDLKNPFFRQKQTANKSKRFRRWPFVVAPVLAGVLAWFFWAAPIWQLKTVDIQGLTRIDKTELENLARNREVNSRWLFFKERNIFLFQEKELYSEITDKYNFAQLEIRKILPNKLEIKISERPYAFIFQQGSEYNYASGDGYIIKEVVVLEEDKAKYSILENRSEVVSIGSKNKLSLKQEYLDFFFDLSSKLAEHPDLPAERFIIDQELNSLTVKFKDGPAALFNIKNDAGEQVADLALVKKEKIRDNFSKTNYIDLRYGNRIFIN